ncbi:hypothetical protein FNV43_RR16934 [Rhamnella rubrinervis]|uniref:S1 motif domain-containing protein n=1 Tax=Rhamnella rubrinervis TaxID=2594499 RepID=A0A8K0MCU7_9ROSA|nr:hypothetical protein FNV43_RR16934 [Rhamnella rubrinervis]
MEDQKVTFGLRTGGVIETVDVLVTQSEERAQTWLHKALQGQDAAMLYIGIDCHFTTDNVPATVEIAIARKFLEYKEGSMRLPNWRDEAAKILRMDPVPPPDSVKTKTGALTVLLSLRGSAYPIRSGSNREEGEAHRRLHIYDYDTSKAKARINYVGFNSHCKLCFSYNSFLRWVTIELLSTFASGFASLHYVVKLIKLLHYAGGTGDEELLVVLNYCNLSQDACNAIPQRFLLPLSTSLRLFPPYSRVCSLHHRSSIHLASATGTDVAVEEPDSPVADEDSSGVSEVSSNAADSGKSSTISDASPTSAQPKRSRPVKKSEMPPITNEELVPGATFTGKDVGSVVSVGQEVKVKLVDANLETGRISLTMREKDAPKSSDKAGPGRRNASKPGQRKGEVKKVSKFVLGQDLEGTVKNKIRAGAFISLPEGEEGFLPISEEVDEGFGIMMGESSLEKGQEGSVRVLRISRGQVTLTMKKEEDVAKMDLQLKRGIVHTATNPLCWLSGRTRIFLLLDEREKEVAQNQIEAPVLENASTTTADSIEDPKPLFLAQLTALLIQLFRTPSVRKVETDGKLDSSAETVEQLLSLESLTDKEPPTAEHPSAPQAGDEVGPNPDEQPEYNSSKEGKGPLLCFLFSVIALCKLNNSSRFCFSMHISFTNEVRSDGGSDLSQELVDEQALSPESPIVEAVKGLDDNIKEEVQEQTLLRVRFFLPQKLKMIRWELPLRRMTVLLIQMDKLHHLIPIVDIARLIASHGIKVSIATTPHNIKVSIGRPTNALSLFRGLILKHSAVGGFMTHCGWNSVLESGTASESWVTWPLIGGQFTRRLRGESGWSQVGLRGGGLAWGEEEEIGALVEWDRVEEP